MNIKSISIRFERMKKNVLLLLLITGAAAQPVHAQDTLPKFTLKNVGGNRIVIGWVNRFESVKQISIQRSFDSTKNFKSILTVPDPTIPENGFVDTKASSDRMFYRLYIMLDKGTFLFSESKRPVLDTAVRKDAVKTEMPGLNVPLIIKDSVVIGPINGNNRPKADIYVPSKRVFTFRDGYVRVVLPEGVEKKYHIKFFSAADDLLFELKDIKEKTFKIDKSNFYRSGWFRFELYENDQLLEKNKFYIPKEF
jgi:hypothetical protein